MALKKGMLIATIGYKQMTVQNPIPWIGMPVYSKSYSKWNIVETVHGKYAQITTGDVLASYQEVDTFDKDSKFILPGQPDTPGGQPNLTYLTGIPLRKNTCNGSWEPSPVSNGRITDFLWVPRDVTISEVFPAAPKKGKRIVVNLKSLNTDGRSTCAQCKSQLNKPIQFWPSMNYCPKCEG